MTLILSCALTVLDRYDGFRGSISFKSLFLPVRYESCAVNFVSFVSGPQNNLEAEDCQDTFSFPSLCAGGCKRMMVWRLLFRRTVLKAIKVTSLPLCSEGGLVQSI